MRGGMRGRPVLSCPGGGFNRTVDTKTIRRDEVREKEGREVEVDLRSRLGFRGGGGGGTVAAAASAYLGLFLFPGLHFSQLLRRCPG